MADRRNKVKGERGRWDRGRGKGSPGRDLVFESNGGQEWLWGDKAAEVDHMRGEAETRQSWRCTPDCTLLTATVGMGGLKVPIPFCFTSISQSVTLTA